MQEHQAYTLNESRSGRSTGIAIILFIASLFTFNVFTVTIAALVILSTRNITYWRWVCVKYIVLGLFIVNLIVVICYIERPSREPAKDLLEALIVGFLSGIEYMFIYLALVVQSVLAFFVYIAYMFIYVKVDAVPAPDPEHQNDLARNPMAAPMVPPPAAEQMPYAPVPQAVPAAPVYPGQAV